MQNVAKHLQEEASTRAKHLEGDVFGRSAFNRYYYATFLRVKAALGELRPEWGSIPHASVPEVLKGTVRETFKKQLKRANKASDYETVKACERAVTAAISLAEIMEEGYAIRVAADYYPNLKIDFSDNHNFKLNAVAVKQAAEWPNKANAFIKTIKLTWIQVTDD